MRVDSDHGSVLLTGDIEARSEAQLLRDAPDALAVDVLLVPHHGSRTSSTPPFIAAAAPAVAVFTPGYRNRFGHPRPDVVARYEATGAQLRRTDLDGALIFDFVPGAALTPRAQRAHDRRYWREVPVRDPTRMLRIRARFGRLCSDGNTLALAGWRRTRADARRWR